MTITSLIRPPVAFLFFFVTFLFFFATLFFFLFSTLSLVPRMEQGGDHSAKHNAKHSAHQIRNQIHHHPLPEHARAQCGFVGTVDRVRRSPRRLCGLCCLVGRLGAAPPCKVRGLVLPQDEFETA